MFTGGPIPAIRNFLSRIDWKLLVFLVLILNVKLAVKFIAIILIYLIRPRVSSLNLSIKKPGLPLFYPVVISIALLNWLLLGGYQNLSYGVVVLTGIGFWLVSMLAFLQIKKSVQEHEAGVIENTLVAFFILNTCVSLYQYGLIVWETGAINPYRYQANYQKYFIRTGDYIKGISFDTSTANAAINAFGVLYFLLRKKIAVTLLCMWVMLLTGSNYTNLMLLAILLYVFVFKSVKEQKAIIISCFLLFVVFMAKVSPQNNKYIGEAFNLVLFHKKPVIPPFVRPVPITERPDSKLTAAEKKEKIATLYLDSIRRPQPTTATVLLPVSNAAEKIDLPKEDIHSQPYQSRSDTSAFQLSLFAFIDKHKHELNLSTQSYVDPGAPGKLIALRQSIHYLADHPSKMAFGAGMGNFSSRLAFRATGLKIAGGFPQKFSYINKDFLSHHLDLYLYFFSNHIKLHSLTNTPDAVYTQLLSEYGIMGVIAFIVFYLGYFLRSKKTASLNLPIVALLLGLFLTEYWFEQLSIIIVFELMMLSNINSFSNSNTSYDAGKK